MAKEKIIKAADVKGKSIGYDKIAPKKTGIVEAVGTATLGGKMGEAIEKAMSAAYLKAIEDGVKDPAKHRELMQAARKRVKEEFAEADRQERDRLAAQKT